MGSENAWVSTIPHPHRIDSGTVVTAASCLRREVMGWPPAWCRHGTAVALQPLAVEIRVQPLRQRNVRASSVAAPTPRPPGQPAETPSRLLMDRGGDDDDNDVS